MSHASPRSTATTTSPLLRIRELSIAFEVDRAWIPAVSGIDLDLDAGQALALVGESGSGKSTTAMAIPGLLANNARVSGSINLAGTELVGADDATFRSVRGEKVGVIFQEPMTALNPVYTIGWQIVEAIRAHRDLSKKQATDRAVELLELVDMPEPGKRLRYYPHQLSGGQRQRAMIAQALACDPRLIIADEPTTALDVTVQAEILDLIRELRHRVDAAILLITHDMGVVADLADRVLVMKDGKVIESDTTPSLFANPKQSYTRALLAAVPHLRAGRATPPATSLPTTAPAAPSPAIPPALHFDHATIEFSSRRTKFRAVDDVSLTVNAGEVVGLVGESGSGKSTLGKAAVGLVTLTSGAVHVAGTDITSMSQRSLSGPRTKIGVVFQDPGSSLNPRWPVGESIAEPLLLHSTLSRAQRSSRVNSLLDAVQLPQSMRNRYPHQLSGGQRQRIGIARALALEPDLLIADEPTSALDVSVQARVLELLRQLQSERGFATLFISHDLAVVEELADQIVVLRSGKLVESGSPAEVLNHPSQEYTARLIAAVPVPDPVEQAKRRAARAVART